jgi:hypothetical protein
MTSHSWRGGSHGDRHFPEPFRVGANGHRPTPSAWAANGTGDVLIPHGTVVGGHVSVGASPRYGTVLGGQRRRGRFAPSPFMERGLGGEV